MVLISTGYVSVLESGVIVFPIGCLALNSGCLGSRDIPGIGRDRH